ncbi:acyltransferase [Mycetocola zhadangensis]|uniref:acyltransferase n=1 Tax=Mycetocola zhadangensis TaxID=1164595 RepID=UPI003A4E6121
MEIGAYAAFAGHDSRVLSHSVDLARDAQVAYPVIIGERSFVGTRSLLLGGAVLPPRSILAAGSVLTRRADVGEPGLWAGAPAKFKGPVNGAWFTRSRMSTSRVYVPETDQTVEDAI